MFNAPVAEFMIICILMEMFKLNWSKLDRENPGYFENFKFLKGKLPQINLNRLHWCFGFSRSR